MATIDLRTFDDQGFVIHFGGDTQQINALTFGNALVSIAETLRAINHEVNPGHSIEVAIESLGPGSFRARLKTRKKPLLNLFSAETVRDLIIALFATYLWDKIISPSTPPIIIIDSDAVIIEYHDDRIIVPKEAFDQKEKVFKSPAVNEHMVRTMEVLEEDASVTSFGITKNLGDPAPIMEIPRALFPTIRERALAEPSETSRLIEVDAVLSVHKAVFERSQRKWEFVWNGFRISAPILDQTFFDRLAGRCSGGQTASSATFRRVVQNVD